MWYTREWTLRKIEVSKDIHSCNIRFYLTQERHRGKGTPTNMAWSMKFSVLSYLYVSCLFLSLFFFFFLKWSMWLIFFPGLHSISAHLNGYCNFIISLFSLITSVSAACSQQTKKKKNLLCVSQVILPTFQKSLLFSIISNTSKFFSDLPILKCYMDSSISSIPYNLFPLKDSFDVILSASSHVQFSI